MAGDLVVGMLYNLLLPLLLLAGEFFQCCVIFRKMVNSVIRTNVLCMDIVNKVRFGI